MNLLTYTLGCKVNFYDTEALKTQFIKAGYKIVTDGETADVVLINTCSVTNLSEKKSRQLIRRARKNNPAAFIVAAGCYSQTSPEFVAEMPEVDLIIGTKDRNKILEFINERRPSALKKIFVSDLEKDFEETEISNFTDKTRAFIKIQEGCNEFCSYCVIPFARGRARNRDAENVLREARRLAAAGFKEIVFTGIRVSSYDGLPELLRRAADIDGIERIRLSSVDIGIIGDEFISAIKNIKKMCNHLHISLQSGSEKILRAMNRKYSPPEYFNAINLLRKNIENLSVTTDIIVGFPGETEEDFWESYKFCEEVKFCNIHVFPYSPKKGTKAFNMPNRVTAAEKNRRAKIFLELSSRLQTEFLNAQIGRTESVLFERDGSGFAKNYARVKVSGAPPDAGDIFDAEILGVEDFSLFGKIKGNLIDKNRFSY